MMVSITLTIVFVLIGLAFKSVIAPLRSVRPHLQRSAQGRGPSALP